MTGRPVRHARRLVAVTVLCLLISTSLYHVDPRWGWTALWLAVVVGTIIFVRDRRTTR